jgi:hypothetical protein
MSLPNILQNITVQDFLAAQGVAQIAAARLNIYPKAPGLLIQIIADIDEDEKYKLQGLNSSTGDVYGGELVSASEGYTC